MVYPVVLRNARPTFASTMNPLLLVSHAESLDNPIKDTLLRWSWVHTLDIMVAASYVKRHSVIQWLSSDHSSSLTCRWQMPRLLGLPQKELQKYAKSDDLPWCTNQAFLPWISSAKSRRAWWGWSTVISKHNISKTICSSHSIASRHALHNYAD